MLKEKITGTKVIGLLLGIFGAVLLITRKSGGGEGDNILLGDAMIILSAFMYSVYFIAAKPLMDKYKPIAITRWIFTIGFFMTLPVCIHDFSQIQWQQFGSNEWLMLLQVVVPGTFFAYVFNLYGLKVLNASTAGTIVLEIFYDTVKCFYRSFVERRSFNQFGFLHIQFLAKY